MYGGYGNVSFFGGGGGGGGGPPRPRPLHTPGFLGDMGPPMPMPPFPPGMHPGMMGGGGFPPRPYGAGPPMPPMRFVSPRGAHEAELTMGLQPSPMATSAHSPPQPTMGEEVAMDEMGGMPTTAPGGDGDYSSMGEQNMQPMPFDSFLCDEQFPQQGSGDESSLTQLILKRHQEVCPNPIEQAAISNLVTKVHQALEKIVVAPESFEPVAVEEIREVGSYKKGTMLTKSNVADIVVILRSLPTMESVNALGQKIVHDLRAEQNEIFGCVARDYGCEIAATNAVVRLLITILPKNARFLDPVLHLSERVMQANMAMIRHARWFDEHANQSPVRILIKVLKDIRRRYDGLKALDIWALELLAHYCVVHTLSGKQLSLPQAFRRFFQIISAGMLMPHSPALIDPCDQPRRIHQSLTLEEMDNICSTAQTLLRVIIHGGAELVLGLNFKPESNVTAEITVLNGVLVTPLERAYYPAEAAMAM